MRSPRYYARSVRGSYWNRRNANAIARGRNPRRARVAAEVKSRTPIFRDRINPAHGDKHREDARLHRLGNESLARMKTASINRRDSQGAFLNRSERAAEHARGGRSQDPERDGGLDRITHGSINRDQFPERQAPASRQRPGRDAR